MPPVLTNLGEQWVADRCAAVATSSSGATGAWVAWAASTVALTKASTALVGETLMDRAFGAVATSGAGSAAKWFNQATLTASSAMVVGTAGCFATSSGAANPYGLILGGEFDAVPLSSGDQILFTFTLDPS